MGVYIFNVERYVEVYNSRDEVRRDLLVRLSLLRDNFIVGIIYFNFIDLLNIVCFIV